MQKIEADDTKYIFLLLFLAVIAGAFLYGEASRGEYISIKMIFTLLGIIFFLSGLLHVRYQLTPQQIIIKRIYGLWVQKKNLENITALYQLRHDVNSKQKILGLLSSRKMFRTTYRILTIKFNHFWETIWINEQSISSKSFNFLYKKLNRQCKANRKKKKKKPRSKV